MSDLLWRVIIAVICVVLLFALMPPLFGLIGMPVDNNLIMIIRICIAGIAILYVLRGGKPIP